jgi:glycerophosphoryl diester phosphodiesterase
MEAKLAVTLRRPLIIAHRGFSAMYPENTLAAIHGAIRLGVDYVEIDVQETCDGKLAVFHDYRLNRICGVRGRVRDTTLAEMKRLNPTIPSLTEVLRACRSKTRLLIEVKGADAHMAADEIEQQHMEHEVIVFSLSIPCMKALARANPRISRFGLIARNLKSQIADLKSSVAVQGLGISRRLVTSPEVVHMIHCHGWKLFVWTVNRAAEMRRLASWGVDGLITNYPDRAKTCLARRSA